MALRSAGEASDELYRLLVAEVLPEGEGFGLRDSLGVELEVLEKSFLLTFPVPVHDQTEPAADLELCSSERQALA